MALVFDRRLCPYVTEVLVMLQSVLSRRLRPGGFDKAGDLTQLKIPLRT